LLPDHRLSLVELKSLVLKKLLLLFVAVAFFSCNNTNPTKTSSEFNYEGHKVWFVSSDTLITNATIKRIKNHTFSTAKYNCKYPESFIPTFFYITRVDSWSENLEEFIEGNIAFNGTITFKAKNSYGMAGSESLSFYYSENGEYLGKLPTIDLD
jgi:hypothetical protein